MPEYVRKTALGGYKVDSDGDSVLLSRKAYDNLMMEHQFYLNNSKNVYAVQDKNTELKGQISTLRFELEANQREYDQIIDNIHADYQKDIASLSEKNQELEKDLRHMENLNRNLIRINRERANQERNIPNGKRQSGFRVIGTRQIPINYNDRGHIKSELVWETTIQGPYSSKFDIDVAIRQTQDELRKNGIEIGITDWKTDATFEEVRKSPDFETEKNIVFSERFKWSVGEKFWEVTILHTKILTSLSFAEKESQGHKVYKPSRYEPYRDYLDFGIPRK